MVAVPEALPLVLVPRKDNLVADGAAVPSPPPCPPGPPPVDRSSTWPAARMLSGSATGFAGQVKVNPLAVTAPPGLTPAATNACSERLQPPESRLARSGALSSDTPVLL